MVNFYDSFIAVFFIQFMLCVFISNRNVWACVHLRRAEFKLLENLWKPEDERT